METTGERLLGEEVRHLSSCMRILSEDLSQLQRFISQQFGSTYVSFCKEQDRSSGGQCKSEEIRVESVSKVSVPSASTSSTSADLRRSPRVVLKRCNEYEHNGASSAKKGNMDSVCSPVEEELSTPVVFDALNDDFDDFEDEDTHSMGTSEVNEDDNESEYDPLFDDDGHSNNSDSQEPDYNIVIKSEVDLEDSDDEVYEEIAAKCVVGDTAQSCNVQDIKVNRPTAYVDDDEKPEVMETVRGHPMLMYKNYVFHFCTKSKYKKLWKCNYTKPGEGGKVVTCSARIHTNHNLENILLMKEYGEHNHRPSNSMIFYRKSMLQIKSDARTTTKMPSEIVQSFMEKISEKQKKALPKFRSLTRFIQKYRTKLGINIPTIPPKPSQSVTAETSLEHEEEDEEERFLRRRKHNTPRKPAAPPPLRPDMFPITEKIPVEVIESSRGFPLAIKGNYLFNYKKHGVNKLMWKCHRNNSVFRSKNKGGCYAGLYTNEDMNDLYAVAEGKHTHGPEPKLCDYKRFTKHIKEASFNSTRPATELAVELHSTLTEEQKKLYPSHQSIAHQINRRRRQRTKTDTGAVTAMTNDASDGDPPIDCINND